MQRRLILFAPASGSSDHWNALWPDAADQPRQIGPAELSELFAEGIPAHDSCWLVLAGQDVMRTTVRVPARSRSQARQAAPFLLEEFLAEDVDHLHLAFGRSSGRNHDLPVAATQPHRLRQLLEALQDIGLQPTLAITAVDLLTPPASTVEVVVDPDLCWVRAAAGQGVCIERALLEPVLAGLPDRTTCRTIRVFHQASDRALDLAQLEVALADGDGEGPHVELAPDHHTPEQRLGQAWLRGNRTPETAVNLLQGEFRPKQEQQGNQGPWRWVAGLAAVLVLAQLGTDLLRASWLEARAAGLRDESVALFRQHFPDRQRIPDPRREVETMMAGGGDGPSSGLLPMLGSTAAEIARVADNGQIQLRSLNYNARRGDMAIDLNTSEIDLLEALQAGLENRHGSARIESATQEAQAIRGRLRVGGSQ